MRLQKQSGYIALMVTVIISSILLITITAIGAQAALHRFNVANTEEKIQSRYLANSCAYQALVNFAYDNIYIGNESLEVASGESCSIENIPPPSNGSLIIKTKAEINQHNAEDTLIININDLSVISWQEE